MPEITESRTIRYAIKDTTTKNGDNIIVQYDSELSVLEIGIDDNTVETAKFYVDRALLTNLESIFSKLYYAALEIEEINHND